MEHAILITGCSGMIGAAAVDALAARGAPAWACGRDDADLLRPGAAVDLIRRTRPETLVHCAWDMRAEAITDEATQGAWVEASLDLLDTFGRAGGRHAVVIGTCAEYAWNGGCLVEDKTPLQPRTVYGRAKQSLRERATELATAQGWTLAWPRVFWVYGPRERPGRLVPSVVAALLAGAQVPCTHGRQERDYLYSGDVGHAVAALALQGYEGPVNVASGNPVAVRDIVRAFATELGRPDLINWGALPVRPDEPARLMGDARRLTKAVPDWSPMPLSEGVRQTVAWWRRCRIARDTKRVSPQHPNQ
jgi:nucleoside-diphosphate-sugar epimerase